MDSLQHIKGRLGAVKNIGQITKAMEVVSATKMRRAQEIALASRAYGFAALAALETIVRNAPEGILSKCALATQRPVRSTLIVVVVSDRGLAGAFNAQVLRATDAYLATQGENGGSIKLAIVGKKAFPYATRRGVEIAGTFFGVGDYASPDEIRPISDLVTRGFVEGAWDRVVFVSTHFRTTLRQDTVVRELLPLHVEGLRAIMAELIPEHGRFSDLREPFLGSAQIAADYLFEPSAASLVDALVPHLVNMQIYQLVLEANASEHSARRVAMKSASDNAEELRGSLTLSYNKARQAGITKEMTEITGALITLQ